MAVRTFSKPIIPEIPGKKKSQLISEKSVELLNYRIQEEEMSYRLYESMRLWCEDRGYNGAAKVFCEYAKEELDHAGWAKDYLLGLGEMPSLMELEKPKCEFKDLEEILNLAYEHEVEILDQCKELAKNCMEEGDHMLYTLALKYLEEQHEELSKIQDWLDQLNTFGTSEVALRLLDNEMAK